MTHEDATDELAHTRLAHDLTLALFFVENHGGIPATVAQVVQVALEGELDQMVVLAGRLARHRRRRPALARPHRRGQRAQVRPARRGRADNRGDQVIRLRRPGERKPLRIGPSGATVDEPSPVRGGSGIPITPTLADRLPRLRWLAVAASAPVAVAGALVPLRGHILDANVGLVLVAVVVPVGVAGTRQMAAVAAVSSALSFDFLHTRPYLRAGIASGDDAETTLLLVVIGLVVGQAAGTGGRARGSPEASRGEVRRVHRLVTLGARGGDPTDVIGAAHAELTSLLGLAECRFEAAPFASTLERLDRSGQVTWPEHRPRAGRLELPAAGVELPVLGRGHLLGRFVLRPSPGATASLEQRVVAVAMADHVGAVLAAPQTQGSRSDG